MTHGDNNGLVLPPRVAPIQVIVLPIAQHKPGVADAAQAVVDRLKAAGIRVKGDFSDNSPGLEVRRVGDEGRAPAPRTRPARHRGRRLRGRAP